MAPHFRPFSGDVAGTPLAPDDSRRTMVSSSFPSPPEDATSEERFDRIEKTLDEHSKSLAKLEINVEVLKDDVKAIAEGHAATRAAIAREADRVVEHIDLHIGLLERAFKEHISSR
jgi:MoxR-like ATPase